MVLPGRGNASPMRRGSGEWARPPSPAHRTKPSTVRTTPATVHHEKWGANHARAKPAETPPPNQNRTEIEKKRSRTDQLLTPFSSGAAPLVTLASLRSEIPPHTRVAAIRIVHRTLASLRFEFSTTHSRRGDSGFPYTMTTRGLARAPRAPRLF